MKRIYWPQSGPSQLGKAVFWIMIAYYKDFLESHGASYDHAYRCLKPFYNYTYTWPIAYICTHEEAEAFRMAKEAAQTQ